MESRSELAATPGCHCLAARRAARAITRIFDAELRPHGLRSTQFSILAALALKGPTGVGQLAESLGLERTTLTRSAALLERNRWVATAPSRDAREHPLRLTAAGRRKLERALPAWRAAQAHVDRQLAGRADWRALTALGAGGTGRASADSTGTKTNKPGRR